MRLDKYLKVSRIFKRRTIAKEVSNNDRVEINHKVAKPSTPIHISDLVTIYYGERLFEIRVLAIEENTKKADAVSMYEVLRDETVVKK